MSPAEIVKGFMVKGMTPEGMARAMAGKLNNPMINNLIQMVEKGENNNAEKFARNVLKDMGFDFDKEMANMKKTLNIQ